MQQIDSYIAKAADMIVLSASACRFDIRNETAGDGRCTKLVIVDENLEIESSNFCRFLGDSQQLIMMGITGGADIAAEISRLQKEKKMTEAVVIDAAAGEIVDAGFDWLAALYRRELSREAVSLTKRRFSAGYGDFNIEFQRDIYRLLNLSELGVEITDSCMLMPEKTVTAVYGIERGVQDE